MESLQQRIGAAVAALRHGATPSTTVANTPTPTKVRLQFGSNGGRLGFGPAVRPRPAATADGSSSLSVWPMMASFLDAWIWAWWAQIRVENFFYFQKLILGVGP
jgi:hypothetical protein